MAANSPELSTAPGCTLRAVFENDTGLGQFLADGVGARKILGLARGKAFGDELLDVWNTVNNLCFLTVSRFCALRYIFGNTLQVVCILQQT